MELLLYILVFLIIGILIGLQIGYNLAWIKAKLNDIYNRDPEPTAQVVTPKPPGYADVNDLSAIVTPKTPEQVEREEQQRVRDL